MTVVPMKIDLAGEHTVYRAKDGERLPGVTTVLGVLAKPPLLKWYADQEREGIFSLMGDGNGWSAHLLRAKLPLYKNGKPKPFAEVKRDAAADTGTVTHARIEAWLKQTALASEAPRIRPMSRMRSNSCANPKVRAGAISAA